MASTVGGTCGESGITFWDWRGSEWGPGEAVECHFPTPYTSITEQCPWVQKNFSICRQHGPNCDKLLIVSSIGQDNSGPLYTARHRTPYKTAWKGMFTRNEWRSIFIPGNQPLFWNGTRIRTSRALRTPAPSSPVHGKCSKDNFTRAKTVKARAGGIFWVTHTNIQHTNVNILYLSMHQRIQTHVPY